MSVYDKEGDAPQINVNGRKMKLLEVMRIIEEETDAEHTLTANQIVNRLKAKGFSHADRKGVYDDINALNLFYTPVEKRNLRKAKRIEKDETTWGYYLDNRPFSVPEVKLMIDAIQSSKFLSEAKTEDLIEALEALVPKEEAKGLKRQVIVSNRVKNMNVNIHNNVDHINYAIERDVQIKFKYFDYTVQLERAYRKKGGWYQVSPLTLVYTDDNYYLLAYVEDKGKVMNYRVDRMANISSLSLPRVGKDTFDKEQLGMYQKYTFSMYSGKIEKVTMRFRNSMMNTVIDKFGKPSYVKTVDADHFEITVTVAVSPQFFGWVFGLGNYVSIVGPENVKNQMKKKLEDIHKRYE